MSDRGGYLRAEAELLKLKLRGASLGNTIDQRDEVGEITVEFDQKVSVLEDGSSEDSFRIGLDFILNVLRVEDQNEPVVWIEATYELDYQCLGLSGNGVSRQDLEAFGRDTSVFNAWPYLREFVQSSLNRMDLPRITLPLLRRREAQMTEQENQDEKRRA